MSKDEIEYEWGPWITHTPGPCPVEVGTYIQVETFGLWRGPSRIREGLVTAFRWRAPNWKMISPCDPRATMVLRYRVRQMKTRARAESELEAV